MNKITHIIDEFWGTTFNVCLGGGQGICRVVCKKDEPSVAWLYGVSVIPASRRMGIGNKLLQEAIDIAKQEEKKYLYLTVTPGTFVEQWYKRKGFEFVCPDEGWNYVVLRKDL